MAMKSIIYLVVLGVAVLVWWKRRHITECEEDNDR